MCFVPNNPTTGCDQGCPKIYNPVCASDRNTYGKSGINEYLEVCNMRLELHVLLKYIRKREEREVLKNANELLLVIENLT